MCCEYDRRKSLQQKHIKMVCKYNVALLKQAIFVSLARVNSTILLNRELNIQPPSYHMPLVTNPNIALIRAWLFVVFTCGSGIKMTNGLDHHNKYIADDIRKHFV